MNDVFSFTVIFLMYSYHGYRSGGNTKVPITQNLLTFWKSNFPSSPARQALNSFFNVLKLGLSAWQEGKNIIEIWFQYLGIVWEKTLRRNKFLLLVALIQHFHTIFHKLNCSNLWASYEASKLWKMSPYLFSNRTMTTWCCLLTTFKAMSIEVSSNWPNKTRFDFLS